MCIFFKKLFFVTNRLRHSPFDLGKSGQDIDQNQCTGEIAIIQPSQLIEDAGTLSEGSSMFKAEAHGILRALEIAFNLEGDTQELCIFTDFKSVLKALDAPDNYKHNIIQKIIRVAYNLKSSGTKTRIC